MWNSYKKRTQASIEKLKYFMGTKSMPSSIVCSIRKKKTMHSISTCSRRKKTKGIEIQIERPVCLRCQPFYQLTNKIFEKCSVAAFREFSHKFSNYQTNFCWQIFMQIMWPRRMTHRQHDEHQAHHHHAVWVLFVVSLLFLPPFFLFIFFFLGDCWSLALQSEIFNMPHLLWPSQFFAASSTFL